LQLKDAVTLITGGGRGIGRAIALRLAAEGAALHLCARTEKELAEVSEKITKSGGRCNYAIVDVSQFEEVKCFVAKIRAEQGRIDVLINNAGYCAPLRPVEEVTDQEYRRTLATNVDSVFHFTRAVLPIMKAKNYGAIVTVSSGCGRRGFPGLSIYSASKFAVQGLMEAVAAELESTSIRCLLINPGAVATKMRADLFGQEEAGRHQSPGVVADVVRCILKEEIEVPNGGGICIRGGKIAEVYGPGK